MTAEEMLQDSLKISHFYSDKYEKMCCFSDEVQLAMQEYAKLKCKELLEIVAEKAEPTDFGYAVSRYSIMNAVDLDEFID